MKLKNLFNKKNNNQKVKVQSLDKKQLAKLVGGADKEKSITINTTHVEY